MAEVIVEMRVTLENSDVAPETTEEKIKEIITSDEGRVQKSEIIPYVFGLKAINISFILPEKDGGTDEIETQIKNTENVGNLEILHLSRTLG